jgi:hypothetical protein
MPDPWWICATCNSLNRQRARKCYSCGTATTAGQAEVIDLLDSGFLVHRGPGTADPPRPVTAADAAAKGAVDVERVHHSSLASSRVGAATSTLVLGARPLPTTLYDDDEPLLKPVERPPAFVPAKGDGPTGVAPYVRPGGSTEAAPAKRRIDWRFTSVALLAVAVVSVFFAALTFTPPH